MARSPLTSERMASSTATVSAIPSAVMSVVVLRTTRFRRLYARGMAMASPCSAGRRQSMMREALSAGTSELAHPDGRGGADADQRHRKVEQVQVRQEPAERTVRHALHQQHRNQVADHSAGNRDGAGLAQNQFAESCPA